MMSRITDWSHSPERRTEYAFPRVRQREADFAKFHVQTRRIADANRGGVVVPGFNLPQGKRNA